MSIALIEDRLLIAQDAPFVLQVAVWSDFLKTQPAALKNCGAWLWGQAVPATTTANYLTVSLSQRDLETLPANVSLRLETQWQDESGNVGRADFCRLLLAPGASPGFLGAEALGLSYDVVFAAESGTADVIGLCGGPAGPSEAASVTLSDDAQAFLSRVLNIEASDAETAILALARRLAILAGTDPDQATVFQTL